MGQILLLRVSWFRTACGIPKLIKHPPPKEGNKEGEGFLSMIKKSKTQVTLMISFVYLVNRPTLSSFLTLHMLYHTAADKAEHDLR